jgi:hypothetical protein
MRFGFFRDSLCNGIDNSFTFSGFTPLPLNLNNRAEIVPQSPTTPTSSAPPTFTAAQLEEKLGISKKAAELLTDGGKLTLTEQQVLERLKSPEIKTYDISKRRADSNLDSFENSELLKKIDKLDGQSGNIKVKDGNLAWEAAGATVTQPPNKPSEQPTTNRLTINNPTVEPKPASSIEQREAGFVADPQWNPPSQEVREADTTKIQNAIKATGGDKNQKIEYQGVLLTDNGNQGSDNVRLYSVGEGENAKYLGIKQGNGQILSEKELKAHLEELNKARTDENKPKLDPGKIGDVFNKGQYFDLTPKTEA